jgi:Trypsin-like peptidase domain
MIELLARLPDVDNPPDCVRQLIFESEWEDFPYWMHGTGFLTLWSETLFFVTAAHCIQENQQNALRVPIRAGDAKVMTFKKFMTFVVPGEESRDLDVAVFHVEPASWSDLYDLRGAAVPIPQSFSFDTILTEVQTRDMDVETVVLRAVGFPRSAKESIVDLAQRRIVSQPMEVVFKYKHHSNAVDRHIGSIMNSPMDDLDGMSGSPVFLRSTRPEESPRRYVVAGMLVRASREMKLVEFVSGELLRNALQFAANALRAR